MSIKVNGKKVAGIGRPGADGKSAYQQAVEGGYKGTEDEFKSVLANASPKPKSTLVTLPSPLGPTTPRLLQFRACLRMRVNS